MSENETHIGKVQEFIFQPATSFSEKIDIIRCLGFEIKPEDVCEKEEHIDDKGFVAFDGRIFTVVAHEEYDYEDIAEASSNPNGTISFVLKFYNGGTYFDEMLKEAILKMEKGTLWTKT